MAGEKPKLGKKILIIEDERSMLEILKEKFVSEGFEVVTAMDGKAALGMALVEHPDLIVLDILLPVMDGLSFLQDLAKDKWGKEVPVAVYTNVGEARDVSKNMGANVYDFLPKAERGVNDLVASVKERLGIA